MQKSFKSSRIFENFRLCLMNVCLCLFVEFHLVCFGLVSLINGISNFEGYSMSKSPLKNRSDTI